MKSRVLTMYGDRNSLSTLFSNPYHMFVWYDAFKLVTEASVDFYQLDSLDGFLSHEKVKMCGICPLYAEDAAFMLGK